MVESLTVLLVIYICVVGVVVLAVGLLLRRDRTRRKRRRAGACAEQPTTPTLSASGGPPADPLAGLTSEPALAPTRALSLKGRRWQKDGRPWASLVGIRRSRAAPAGPLSPSQEATCAWLPGEKPSSEADHPELDVSASPPPRLAGEVRGVVQAESAAQPPMRRSTRPRGFVGSRRASAASWHADVSLDVTGTLDLLVVAGSRVGGEHESRGTPREDAYATAVSAPAGLADAPVLYAVVADGVGRTRLSQLAAVACTAAFIDQLQERIPTQSHVAYLRRQATARQAFASGIATAVAEQLGSQQIADLAEDYGRLAIPSRVRERPHAPATTAVFAALVTDGRVTRGIWGAVGDARAAVVDVSTGSVRWLTHPPSQDSAPTEALPQHPQAIQVGELDMTGDDVLVLVSDGMAEVLDALPQELAGLLSSMATGASQARHALLTALELQVQGEHDDRTLVAVMRR